MWIIKQVSTEETPGQLLMEHRNTISHSEVIIQTSYYHSYIDNRINVGGWRTKSIWKTDIILKVLWHFLCCGILCVEHNYQVNSNWLHSNYLNFIFNHWVSSAIWSKYFYYIPHDLSMPKLKTLTLNEERVSRLC